ncbi:nitrilase-related carbon-nitrogen hydrolase (plasmid) [Halorutilales archaeon Cl-col2-1]
MEKSDDDLDSPDPEVAACQIQVEDLDVETNLQRIREYALQLPDSTDIAIFPEYSLTGYTDDERVYGVAMTRDEVVPKVRGISEETDTEILFGFIEEREDGEEYYNAAGYVTPEKDTVYRKRNLWSSEEELLSQGEERVVIKTSAMSSRGDPFLKESAFKQIKDLRTFVNLRFTR